MSATIWKIELGDRIVKTHEMPADSRILAVQIQHGAPVLWAEVDPSAPKVLRRFEWAATGGSVPRGVYVGTVQLHDGALVLHLYDLGEVQP